MDFPPLPRRRFLKACVATAGLLPVAATTACSASAPGDPVAGGHATPAGRCLVLDARRVAIVEAFAAATLATGDGFPTVREAGVARRIDEELHFADPAVCDEFLLAIDAADWLPLVFGHFSRLHRLPAAEARAFLDGLAATPLDTVRAILGGLRMVTGLVYYAHPATRAATGYDGPHAGLPPRDDEQRAAYRAAVEAQA